MFRNIIANLFKDCLSSLSKPCKAVKFGFLGLIIVYLFETKLLNKPMLLYYFFKPKDENLRKSFIINKKMHLNMQNGRRTISS